MEDKDGEIKLISEERPNYNIFCTPCSEGFSKNDQQSSLFTGTAKPIKMFYEVLK